MGSLKSKLLNKEYSRFRLISGVIFYSVTTLVTVFAVGFIIFSVPELSQKLWIFYLAIFTGLFQLIVIWHLYYSKEIPAFARQAIYFTLMLSNMWLCLFMFSLKPIG